jgi:hypothetical protein
MYLKKIYTFAFRENDRNNIEIRNDYNKKNSRNC